MMKCEVVANGVSDVYCHWPDDHRAHELQYYCFHAKLATTKKLHAFLTER